MRDRLSAAVGPRKPNRSEDVRLVQTLLNRQSSRTGVLIPVTGTFDRATLQAIQTYEQRVLHHAIAHGVVEPNSELLRQLSMSQAQRRMLGAAGGLRLPPRTGDAQLQEEDFQQAATSLQCEVRAIRAVTAQEAPRGAFDDRGRPSILFERHLFHRFTGGIHDRTATDLSNPLAGGYGTYASQYDRLQRAYALDSIAALRATSWGAFQILGDNAARCGFGAVGLFVTSMCQSVQQQLAAFVAYIQFSPALTQALRNKQWATFASMYNGPSYRKNHYDTNLERLYEQAKP